MVKLTKGVSAPDFRVKDIYDKPVSLAALRGKIVLLSFFRYAGCPWCNLAIHRLSKEAPKLQKHGLEIVTFIQSSRENVLKDIVGRQAPVPPFTLVADPARAVYQLYGVEDSIVAGIKSIVELPAWVDATVKQGFGQSAVDGSLLLVPAQFIVNTEGFIDVAHYGSNYNDHLPFVEIYNALVFGADSTGDVEAMIAKEKLLGHHGVDSAAQIKQNDKQS